MTKASKFKPPKELTRKQQSRAEREARQQRWLLIGLAGVLVIVFGLLGYGVLNERVLEPRQPVAKVGGVEISTEAFQKRVRYQYHNLVGQRLQLQQQRAQFGSDPNLSYFTSQIDQQIAQIESQLSNVPVLSKQVLDSMAEEEIIRQEAARRNITVSPDEVTQFIEQDLFEFYRVTPTPAPTRTPLPTPSTPITQTPTPTMTPVPSPTPVSEADFNAAYKDHLANLAQRAQMTEEDFRRLVENELLRRKLQAAFTAETPSSVDQIKLRYVRFESDEAAAAAEGILAGGTSFSQFYAAVGSGQVVSATNGESSWIPVDDLSQQFEQSLIDRLVTMPISQSTGVITNVAGSSYTFQVIGHETRELEQQQKETRGRTAFEKWLNAQYTVTGLIDYLNDRYLSVLPALPSQ